MTQNPHSGYAKGARRRQEILDRAIEVIAERGVHGASLRAIGDAIGVSHAALRHYFSTREELLIEVYRSANERTVERDPDPLEGSVVGNMRHAARRNSIVPGLVQLYSTLVAGALLDENEVSQEFFTRRFADLRDTLAQAVTQEQQAGRIRSGLDPVAVASLVIAASDGLQIQWLLDPDTQMDPSFEVLERLLAN